jgi:hypothetical protein
MQVLHTLGESQFQSGNHFAARVNSLALGAASGGDPDDELRASALTRMVAILAQSSQKLNRQEAQTLLRVLGDLGKTPKWANSESLRILLQNAEWVFATDTCRWTPLEPQAMKSAGGAEMSRQDDGSILVAGINPPNDTYIIDCDCELPRLTALRLDVLRDKRLPGEGPGRLENGTFILTGLEATAVSKDSSRNVKINFRKAIADYVQQGWDPQGIVLGRPNGGWAIWRDEKTPMRDQSLVLEMAEPVEFDGGAKLTITLQHQSPWKAGNLGRFRLSVSNSVPALGDELQQDAK